MPDRRELALQGISRAIAGLPGVRVVEVDRLVRVGRTVFDLAITCESGRGLARLLIRGQAHGYPRDVRNAIWQVAPTRAIDQRVPDIPVVAAPVIGEASRAILRDNHVGFYDASGSLFLDLPGETFEVERPVPKEDRPSLENPYRGSPARVVEVLLDSPDRAWHLDDLALEALVSLSTAHQVCTYLEKRQWMRKEGRRPRATRTLGEPGAVLDAWAAAHSLDRYALRRYAHPSLKPWEAFDRLAEGFWRHRIHYGMTLQSGWQSRSFAWNASHALESLPIAALVEPSPRLDGAMTAAGLEPAGDEATMHLYVTPPRWPRLPSPPRTYHAYASDLQLYLDLWAWSALGRRLARELRDQLFRF